MSPKAKDSGENGLRKVDQLIVPPLTAMMFLAAYVLYSAPAFPVECPALGRPLAWDPKGIFPLDADEPLSSTGRQIVKDLLDAELGRAESRARHALSTNPNDLVPAWALAQVLRVRKTAWSEYVGSVRGQADQPATPAMLLYRLHVCRLAENEMPIGNRRTGNPDFDRIEAELKTFAGRLRPFAEKRLGIAIGVTNVTPYWVLRDRKTLDRYRELHPKEPDIRVLQCQIYLSGLHLGPVETFLTPKATAPEEPQPEKGYSIARSILKDRPNDGLGHYYSGVSLFLLHKLPASLQEFRLALQSDSLPPWYVRPAQTFLANPSFPALRQQVNY